MMIKSCSEIVQLRCKVSDKIQQLQKFYAIVRFSIKEFATLPYCKNCGVFWSAKYFFFRNWIPIEFMRMTFFAEVSFRFHLKWSLHIFSAASSAKALGPAICENGFVVVLQVLLHMQKWRTLFESKAIFLRQLCENIL